MARIVSAEAFVLRARPYRETSKLVAAFTRELGKVQLQAKGGRRPKSKFGAALEVLSHIRVIFYRTEQKHAYTLSDTAIIRDFRRLRDRAATLKAALVVAEFINRNFEIEAPVPGLFRLLGDTLSVLDSGPADPGGVAFAFMFKAAELMGYAPALDRCVVCRRPKAATFAPRLGGVLCAQCLGHEPGAIRIDAATLQALRAIRTCPQKEAARRPFPLALKSLVRSYLSHHIEHFDLKSLRALDEAHEPQEAVTG